MNYRQLVDSDIQVSTTRERSGEIRSESVGITGRTGYMKFIRPKAASEPGPRCSYQS
jgi:hypothetical protein